MAPIFPRFGILTKPNAKVYNLNPAVSGFSSEKILDPDLEQELNRKHARRSKSACRGYSGLAFWKIKHRDGFDNQSVKVVESYSVDKAEETTQKINGCLKVAEDMREGASKLLVNLHQQNEQIAHTHQTAATIDRVLQRGEKLLGSLEGLFPRRWKPRKFREIMGPVLAKDGSFSRKGYYMEQRQTPPSSQSNPRRYRSGSSSSLEKIELEKLKQDDALSELSNLLGKLKGMAVDMGSEIDRQNESLDRMQDDMDELNHRMKGANLRARHLLR